MTQDAGGIVGIDLGTTFSEVAAYRNGRVEVLAWEGETVMPSVVGLDPTGRLLVGTQARNQFAAFPDRTVRSIKRRMGEDVRIPLGDRSFRPQEISALVLAELRRRAEAVLGQPVNRAVITVPAYFSDAQRQATREAGEIAGFEVLRVFHEPTAAALAFEEQEAGDRTVAVYDLGGGTFDVSVVRVQGDVTEVLSSHGDTHLGGDDFDRLLADHLVERLREEQGRDLALDDLVRRRLPDIAEEAKRRLSQEPFVRVREEHVGEKKGVPVHMDLEVSRERYEQLIRPLLERTLDSLHRALHDAGLKPDQLDGILLVGGATRTPLVPRLIEEATGIEPDHRLHPELCVALGAGVLAARLAGAGVARVLVDVTPYSFGPSVLGERNGVPYLHCFSAVIPRNTPLPASRTEVYRTVVPNQTGWDVNIYQGEDPDALRNIRIGRFIASGFSPAPAGSPILCRMDLDLDGLLHVTVIEKSTGLTKRVTIEKALAGAGAEDVAASRARLAELAQGGAGAAPAGGAPSPAGVAAPAVPGAGSSEAAPLALAARARAAAAGMQPEDREDALRLAEAVESAAARNDEPAARAAAGELADLLSYVGER